MGQGDRIVSVIFKRHVGGGGSNRLLVDVDLGIRNIGFDDEPPLDTAAEG
jgi:hypothetical protein